MGVYLVERKLENYHIYSSKKSEDTFYLCNHPFAIDLSSGVIYNLDLKNINETCYDISKDINNDLGDISDFVLEEHIRIYKNEEVRNC